MWENRARLAENRAESASLQLENLESEEQVQYGLQRILVDCCNANDWEIPFQQVTIHRA
ncbi:MAG: hypothetical protein ACLFTU_00160 [Puniceicoccaceae bacterium]